MHSKLVEQQLLWLAPINVRCRRVTLTLSESWQPGDWNLSTVRGAWGKALKTLDSDIYQRVFNGVGPQSRLQTLYAFRPDMDFFGNAYDNLASQLQVPLQWTTFNVPGRVDPVLKLAWTRAGLDGIGCHRLPFSVQLEELPVNPVTGSGSLGEVQWPFESPETPVQCVFPMSVSLTKDRRLNTAPTLTEIFIGALNRLGMLRQIATSPDLNQVEFPQRMDQAWPPFAKELLDLTQTIPQTTWQGVRQDLSRYSGRQKRMVNVQGVVGFLSLPEGAKDLWPFLSALSWTQVGKGTTQGMGRPSYL